MTARYDITLATNQIRS